MANIEIEQYKGQTIEYDVENDKFVCDMTLNDRDKTTKRGALKDLRKEIDTFVKDNLGFKPFKIFRKKSYQHDTVNIIHVKGIRTDGKFTCIDTKYPDRKGFELLDFKHDTEGGDSFYQYDSDFITELKCIESEELAYKKLIETKVKAAFRKLKKFDISNISDYIKAFTKS